MADEDQVTCGVEAEAQDYERVSAADLPDCDAVDSTTVVDDGAPA